MLNPMCWATSGISAALSTGTSTSALQPDELLVLFIPFGPSSVTQTQTQPAENAMCHGPGRMPSMSSPVLGFAVLLTEHRCHYTSQICLDIFMIYWPPFKKQ